MDENPKSKTVGMIKHDIKNQLSSISLCLEQLRFEVPDQNEDCQYYMDTIFTSAKKINELLEDL